jgi:hypothetical protein
VKILLSLFVAGLAAGILSTPVPAKADPPNCAKTCDAGEWRWCSANCDCICFKIVIR